MSLPPSRPALCLLALLTATIAPSAANAQHQTVTVTGQPLQNSILNLYYYAPSSLPSCGSYIAAPGTHPGIFGGTGLLVDIADSAGTIASNMALAINAGTGGLSATATGDVVNITGTAAFEAAVSSPNMNNCEEVGQNALRLTDCAINNLANFTGCDEASPHTTGFQLTGATVPGTPSLPPGTLAFLALIVAGLGGWTLRRRTAAIGA